MTPDRETLLAQLAVLADKASPPSRYIVAFSGGLDSTVLLHALADGTGPHNIPVVAVHVDHGLQAESAGWAEHCRAFAASLSVEFQTMRVTVNLAEGAGPEAAARDARYQALAGCMRTGDWLLSAHHQDDQAETLLINLLRGSGPAGLAGISDIRPFACGWLARPLLSCSRGDLAEYAQQRDLAWTEDPSNSDQHFERNFLRQEILPRLESRWPEAGKRLQRSGRIAGEAAALLDDLAAIDIASLGDRADRLDIDTLSALPVPRQKNVLRYAIRQLELPTPSAAHLQQILDELIPARDDAAPMVRWQGVEIRRYREHLYVLPAVAAAAPADPGRFAVNDAVCLDAGLGLIRLEAGASEGLSGDLVQRGLELRYRHGGEKFKPQGQAHTRKLKKLLQEAGVVPWMRDRIPLLYCDNELVAVADLWLAADAASRPGVAIRWENRPPIH